MKTLEKNKNVPIYRLELTYPIFFQFLKIAFFIKCRQRKHKLAKVSKTQKKKKNFPFQLTTKIIDVKLLFKEINNIKTNI